MEKRRRTSYLPEETDEDVSLRVGEFREDEGDEPSLRVLHVRGRRARKREREKEKEREHRLFMIFRYLE